MPWPDLGVVCCLSGVPGEVRERSFWLKEVSLSLTCNGNYYYYFIIGIIIVIIIIISSLLSRSPPRPNDRSWTRAPQQTRHPYCRQLARPFVEFAAL